MQQLCNQERVPVGLLQRIFPGTTRCYDRVLLSKPLMDYTASVRKTAQEMVDITAWGDSHRTLIPAFSEPPRHHYGEDCEYCGSPRADAISCPNCGAPYVVSVKMRHADVPDPRLIVKILR